MPAPVSRVDWRFLPQSPSILTSAVRMGVAFLRSITIFSFRVAFFGVWRGGVTASSLLTCDPPRWLRFFVPVAHLRNTF